MTVALTNNLLGLLVTAGFVATIAGAQRLRGEYRAWRRETDTWHSADISNLPEPRPALEPPPPRRTPVTKPDHAVQLDAPPVDVLERVLAGLRRLDSTHQPDTLIGRPPLREGRHRLGRAEGTESQRQWWSTPTGRLELLGALTWSTDELEQLSTMEPSAARELAAVAT
jgi:hypothetical protein